MKTIKITFCLAAAMLVIVFSSAAQSGCIADAGPDMAVCGTENSTDIGAAVPAYGGTPPYTFAWEANVTDSFHFINMQRHWTASDLLNDTSFSNPSAFHPTYELGNRSVMFVLHVTDSDSNVCRDTMHAIYSIFGFHLGHESFYIEAGDTIESFMGPYLVNLHLPNTYLWRPNEGLIDSLSPNFVAAPEETTYYYKYVTDSLGCTEMYKSVPVYVEPVSILEKDEESAPEVNVFPNPAHNHFNIDLPISSDLNNIQIFNIQGADVTGNTSFNSENSIVISNLPEGIYLVRFQTEGSMFTRKLIKR